MGIFDLRVFYSHVRSHRHRSLPQIYRSQEQEKRRQYERILKLERRTFTPLVLSAMGGAGPAATAFLKRLADKYASRKSSSYAQTLNWLYVVYRLRCSGQAYFACEAQEL